MADKPQRAPRKLDGVSGGRSTLQIRKSTARHPAPPAKKTDPDAKTDEIQQQDMQEVPGGAFPAADQQAEPVERDEREQEPSISEIEQERARDLARSKQADQTQAVKDQTKAQVKKVAVQAAKKAAKQAAKKVLMQLIRSIAAALAPYMGIIVLIILVIVLLIIVVSQYGCDILPWACE